MIAKALTLLLLGAAGGVPGAVSSDEWLLVRGRADAIGPLSWERLGEVYLGGKSWRLADAATAAREPETSRMVVGSLAQDPLVAELAAGLGASLVDGALNWNGRALEPGTGFAAYVGDPDGAGILFLACGADAAGVLACFQTSLDLTTGGWALARGGRVVERGRFGLVFDVREPVVVRLDRDLEHLLAGAPAHEPERALRLARGLLGYAHVYAQVGAGSDLLPYWEGLLARPSTLELARSFALERDVDAAILGAWKECCAALGREPEPAPVFYVLVADEAATNAKTFGADPVTGRPQVLFNLAALARGRHFDAALVHESTHVFQDLTGKRLVDRALAEGVATLVSQRLVPGLPDADALLWSSDELAAAEARRAELVAAFAEDARATEPARHAPWLVLGIAHDRVNGAPSRTGYYVAWLAAQAWLAADSARTLADLVRAKPDEVLAALR